MDPSLIRRILNSNAKNDLPVYEGNITFSDLMLFINANSGPIKLEDANTIATVKQILTEKKIALELKMQDHIEQLSKWINFINGRRDRRKILLNDGISFLNFMRQKVDSKTYNYLVELYSIEKILTAIKFYELRKITYGDIEFEKIEPLPLKKGRAFR